MRINTNVAANAALVSLGRVQDQITSSVEKLSSGFRINHASDDAAGLGIANTLRANTTALTQASNNAEQANAMLNIAEGGANSVESILERMKELAAQSASSNSGDRNQLQSEFNTLRSEIDRITATTAYQGANLIDGSMGNTVGGASGILSNGEVQTSTVKINGAKAATYTITRVDATHLKMDDGAGNVQQVTVASTGAQTINFSNFGISFQTTTGFDNSGSGTPANPFSANNTVIVAAGASAANFLVSTDAGQYASNDLVSLSSAIDLRSSTLGIGSSTVADQASAQTALSALDTAIGDVSTALGTIGATQNRINFALDNTKSAIQNYTAAESTIRDVDMASEMTMFSKNQILAQAGTAMLAQANQLGAGVLKLLQ